MLWARGPHPLGALGGELSGGVSSGTGAQGPGAVRAGVKKCFLGVSTWVSLPESALAGGAGEPGLCGVSLTPTVTTYYQE